MRPKPKITKVGGGWQVELPAFGFGAPTVKGGFRSREAAGRWLRESSIGASDGTAVQWSPTPVADWHWQWPVVHR